MYNKICVGDKLLYINYMYVIMHENICMCTCDIYNIKYVYDE
ncbi:hypothetical protein GCM10010129_83550 [Streptomyces fumigatiscleroticus]|nr:hypothetical protein GCM10010129_83550 [Streptomyces fumigatiscleroticus]